MTAVLVTVLDAQYAGGGAAKSNDKGEVKHSCSATAILRLVNSDRLWGRATVRVEFTKYVCGTSIDATTSTGDPFGVGRRTDIDPQHMGRVRHRHPIALEYQVGSGLGLGSGSELGPAGPGLGSKLGLVSPLGL